MLHNQLVLIKILCVCLCCSWQNTESKGMDQHTMLDSVHADVNDYVDDTNNEREVNVPNLESTSKDSKIYFIKLKNNISETDSNIYKLKIEIDDKELTELKNNLRNVEDNKSLKISELEKQVFSSENEIKNLKEQIYNIENELKDVKRNFTICDDRKIVATKAIIIDGLYEQITEDIKSRNWNGSIQLMKRHLDPSTQAYKQLNSTSECNYDTYLGGLAEKGYTELIQVMLDNGLPINKKYDHNKRYIMLNSAAMAAQYELVKFLIQRGADVNEKNWLGNTPLHMAAWRNYYSIAHLLVDSGADVNATNDVGGTPIHKAASINAVEIVQLLIDKGANINATDKNGATALHWATVGNCVSVVELLIKKGCDTTVLNKEGKKAEDLAPKKEMKNIVLNRK